MLNSVSSSAQNLFNSGEDTTSDGISHLAGATSPCMVIAFNNLDRACSYLTSQFFKDGVTWTEFAGFEWENRQELAAMGGGLLCATGVGCIITGGVVIIASSMDNARMAAYEDENFWELQKETIIMNIAAHLPGVGLKLMYVLAKRLASAPIGIKQLAQFSLSIRYGGPAVFYDPLKIIQRQLEK